MDPLDERGIPKRDLSKPYLRYDQRELLKHQIRSNQADLDDPTRQVQKPADVAARIRRMRKQLEEDTPPKLTGPALDAAVKERDEIVEEVRKDLIPWDVLHRNPPGTVDRLQKVERKHQRRVLRYRHLQQMIEGPDCDSSELTSIEPHRPAPPVHQSYLGAEAPPAVYSFPSEQFQKNYEQIDWKGKAEAEHEAKTLREQLADTERRNEQLAQELRQARAGNGAAAKKG